MNRFTPFEWITAMRFMQEGKVQTLLIITGVALGVGVIVFMSALVGSGKSAVNSASLREMANSSLPKRKVMLDIFYVGAASCRPRRDDLALTCV